MRTGLLTFHRIVNDGSTLQAYCLFRILETLTRDDVEIVDYQPTRLLLRNVRAAACIRTSPHLRPYELRKMGTQHEFLDAHVRMSSRSCTTDDVDRACGFVSSLGYDGVVVGSDTVWDLRPDGGGPPPPNVYFLPGHRRFRKIAFAASMDRGRPQMVDAGTYARLIEHVADFDFISVRDEATRLNLEGAGIPPRRIHHMPDPTLMWDLSGIAAPPRRRPGSGPLSGVAVIDPDLRAELTRQLRRQGFEVVNLLQFPVEGQLQMPYDWPVQRRLGLHGLLDVLVTDRFHASIFALTLGGARVMMVESAVDYPEPSSKGRDLFARLGIEEMVWRRDKGAPVPPDLVAGYLERASALPWPPVEGLARVRAQADATLRLLGEALSR